MNRKHIININLLSTCKEYKFVITYSWFLIQLFQKQALFSLLLLGKIRDTYLNKHNIRTIVLNGQTLLKVF